MLENIEQCNEPPKQFTFDAVYPEDSITGYQLIFFFYINKHRSDF
jgi:hypothetical protein